jgi:opacity protein-like surface antigen
MDVRVSVQPVGVLCRAFGWISLLFAYACAAMAADDSRDSAYLGVGIGDSQVVAQSPTLGTFREDHLAYKLFVGAQAGRYFAVELSYVDFGHPSGSAGSQQANATVKGAALFAIGYLPVGRGDLYVKAGAAYLDSSLHIVPAYVCTVLVQNCYVGPLDESDNATGFAGGIGAQFRFRAVTVRAEFERFTVAGQRPALTSLALAWSF